MIEMLDFAYMHQTKKYDTFVALFLSNKYVMINTVSSYPGEFFVLIAFICFWHH